MFKRIDSALFLPALLLVSIGSIALTSVAPTSYPFHFLYLALAGVGFLIFSQIDKRTIRAFSPHLYILGLLLLLITPIFGENVRGSVRWIDLGPITLQTSEVIKPLLLLFLAHILSQNFGTRRFGLALLIAIPSFILVFLQPDLGSTIVLIAGFLGAIFIAGLPSRIILLGILIMFIGIPLSWQFLAPYQKERIHSFLDPEADPLSSGYNSIQSKIAVGGGGLTGQGLGQGTQSQLLFLPEKHTDFIFAAISEELGFIGATLIIASFGVLLWRIIVTIKKDNDIFSQIFLSGAFFIIFVQATVNIGMNLGLLPITGIPLPFVSSGGSSLLSMAVLLGIASSLGSTLRERRFSGII